MLITLSNYTDDKITHIDDDIKKIQIKPNMYISYSGSKGSLHLFKEAVNNAIDEAINPNSPCNKVKIYLNLKDNSILIEDNGRGIPEKDMIIACTKLQSGSKFIRATSLGSAGENGVGLTAMNALSNRFIMISERDGFKHTAVFNDGKLYEDRIVTEPSKGGNHGLSVYFQPSDKYLGKCNISEKDVSDWLNDIQFMLPKKFKIDFNLEKPGKESLVNRIYQNKNGMSGVLDILNEETLLNKNIHLSNKTKLEEESLDYVDGKPKKKKVKRFLEVEWAFNYDVNIKHSDTYLRSFCNYVSTIDHGVHMDATKYAIQQFLAKATRESLSEKEAKKLDITFDDVANGLMIALYLSTDNQVHFASQTKEKVSNKELYKPIRSLVSESLLEYFTNNPADLKKIINQVKNNAKIRMATLVAKKSVLKDTPRGDLKDYADKNFIPANNKKKGDYREILIIEGDSAGALAKMARYDPDTQALFCARGVPLNTHDLTVDRVLNNTNLRLLISKLGCNIGDKFNIKNLWYDKIIIMTDADIDGNHIDSQYRSFFYKFMRPIIEEGRLYKMVTPLYKIADKKKFLLNKKDLADKYSEDIKTHVKFFNTKGKELKKAQVAEFLLINNDYVNELNDVSKHKGITSSLMEMLAIFWTGNPDKNEELEFALRTKFPETQIDEDGNLQSIIDMQHYIIKLDDKLYRQMETLRKFLSLNEEFTYEIEVDGVNMGTLYISDIMKKCSRYEPRIVTRYKGIGELTAEELREVAMNPENRKLLRISISDIEDTDEVDDMFETLFSQSTSANKRRKDMMNAYQISKYQLDN